MYLQMPESYDFTPFSRGLDYRTYEIFGAHCMMHKGKQGIRFCVWAPRAKRVSVVGDFNNWDGSQHEMKKIDTFGVWYLFVEGLGEGELYKYKILSLENKWTFKSDPYGFHSEVRPNTASKVYNLSDYSWKDEEYLSERKIQSVYHRPMLIYEVHLGSWKRDEDNRFLSYRQLADELIEYVKDLGYTHLELLPITEHPLDGSWGYQVTGYFSITSRFGQPKDFMYFVDRCHEKGLGVILDWVPAHFCKDEHGLREFDGLPLYEYEESWKADNTGWGTLNFNVGKPEVASFLISNALFLFDKFHVDGLRVDAVASMLYLDYGKEEGKWKKNEHDGRENLQAVGFMKKLNEAVFKDFSYAIMAAEESTSWPMVTKPTYIGGLGYNYKWNMGWMNDLLKYMELDPIHRKWHHNLITFSLMYAFSENYVLPLSHDEVVHGKKSLLSKMSGDYWQKFASLRAFYAFMMGHPGKKLIFMGGEFGQFIEWQFYTQLDWMLLKYDMHIKLLNYVKALNEFYKSNNALWEVDHEYKGFKWIDPNDYSKSIISFKRIGMDMHNFIIVVCNFTPMVYEKYRVGVPILGSFMEVFNSDDEKFGGSGIVNSGVIFSERLPWHREEFSIEINIPPLSGVFLAPIYDEDEKLCE